MIDRDPALLIEPVIRGRTTMNPGQPIKRSGGGAAGVSVRGGGDGLGAEAFLPLAGNQFVDAVGRVAQSRQLAWPADHAD